MHPRRRHQRQGSVGATLCSILTAAGYQAGFYTSPHLSSVRERFRIGNNYISKEDFARLISKIQAVLDGGQITYFECTTTLALLWFAEQRWIAPFWKWAWAVA